MADDFETRLTDALGAGAEQAPRGSGLAEAARARATTRHRSRVGAFVAAVIVLLVVPLAVAVWGDPDSRPAVDPPGLYDPTTRARSPQLPAGWHTETWRDVEVQVPNTWGHGSLTTWCLSGSEPGTPVVQRPGQVTAAIACGPPTQGYGVEFVPSSERRLVSSDAERYRPSGQGSLHPPGAWVGVACGGCSAAVRVAAPTEYAARYLLSTVRKLEDTDSNGCAPRLDDVGARDEEGLSVCRYDASGWLEQSERLVGEDATEASAALSAVPDEDGDARCAGTDDEQHGSVVIASSDRVLRVVFGSSCASVNGVYDGEERVGDVTSDVLHWALSPGWAGAAPGDVLFRLRR